MSERDEIFMAAALELAREAGDDGEVPVGAVLVAGDEIVARGRNRPIAMHDPTAHAEIDALRRAGAALSNYRLPETTLYVTLEPCVMCAGALIHARVARLVFGAVDAKAGAVGSVIDIPGTGKFNHDIDVTGGVLGDESRELLQQFFRARR